LQAQTVRERLLAMLAVFFGMCALLLAGIGLYGVLDYSVFQRRREIGIRRAIGAPAGNIARLVTLRVSGMIVAGALAGVAFGLACAKYIQSLLYQVEPSDWSSIAFPLVAILAVGLIAAVPALIRAIGIDPATVLRAE